MISSSRTEFAAADAGPRLAARDIDRAPDEGTVAKALRGRRIWVFGDIMLDEYVDGMVHRVSPEAPIPIVRVQGAEDFLGGAANVAHACAALGGTVELFGRIGEDQAGAQILDKLTEAGIGHAGVVQQPGYETTRKVRVRANGQHVVRLDYEHAEPDGGESAEVPTQLLRHQPSPDAIIVSDYSKGFLTDRLLASIMRLGKELAVPVSVDPKRADFGAYAGAFVITPNLRELEIAVGTELRGEGAIIAAARRILSRCAAEHVVVTLGERGMLLVPRSGVPELIRSSPRAVRDVTGAGDVVVSVLTMALAARLAISESCALANLAAGMVVAKSGTAVVSLHELLSAVRPMPKQKVLSRAGMVEQVRLWRGEGRRVVFTNGCFDLMHAGHLHLLREAGKHGDVLVVGINSDRSVVRLKGTSRPLVGQDERAEMLAALECVDGVVIFDEDTPGSLIAEIEPDVLVKGGDYQVSEVVGRDTVERRGGVVVIIPLVPARSTSGLVESILSRHPAPRGSDGSADSDR